MTMDNLTHGLWKRLHHRGLFLTDMGAGIRTMKCPTWFARFEKVVVVVYDDNEEL